MWWFQRAQLLNSTKLYCQIQFFRVNLVTTKIVQETKCHIEWFFKNSRLRIYVNQNYIAIFMKMIQITFPLTIRKKIPKRNQKLTFWDEVLRQNKFWLGFFAKCESLKKEDLWAAHVLKMVSSVLQIIWGQKFT